MEESLHLEDVGGDGSSKGRRNIWVVQVRHLVEQVVGVIGWETKNTIFPLLSKTSHKQEILPPCPDCGYQETIKCGVVKTYLDCFRQDGERLQSLHCYEYGWPLLRLRLTRRGTCTPLPNTKLPHQVIETAHKLHANNAFGNYSLIDNNCEHFTAFC
ncbi:hypothetical protein NL676_020367 [Syzygium grande]|nr:hypothetical protein NL676_020367 [Syzygium grande]